MDIYTNYSEYRKRQAKIEAKKAKDKKISVSLGSKSLVYLEPNDDTFMIFEIDLN